MPTADPKPIPFSPSMPDITKKQPIKIFAADPYTLFLLKDVVPIGGGDFFTYPYVIAAFDNRINAPVCFVTLESSAFASNILCVFENDGKHANYGSLSGPNLMQDFVDRAMGLVRERFSFRRIEEMQTKQSRQSWWKFW